MEYAHEDVVCAECGRRPYLLFDLYGCSNPKCKEYTGPMGDKIYLKTVPRKKYAEYGATCRDQG